MLSVGIWRIKILGEGFPLGYKSVIRNFRTVIIIFFKKWDYVPSIISASSNVKEGIFCYQMSLCDIIADVKYIFFKVVSV